MSMRNETRYCPHCGAAYTYDPGSPNINTRRCYSCNKVIKPDIFGVDDMIGRAKNVGQTIKAAKKIADLLKP